MFFATFAKLSIVNHVFNETISLYTIGRMVTKTTFLFEILFRSDSPGKIFNKPVRPDSSKKNFILNSELNSSIWDMSIELLANTKYSFNYEFRLWNNFTSYWYSVWRFYVK